MIIGHHAEGWTAARISRELRISASTIYYTFRRHGLASGRQGGPEGLRVEWVAQAEAMWAEGKTLQAIGDVIGVTRERVRQVLTQRGIVTRVFRRHAHRCGAGCRAVLAADPDRINLTALARTSGVPLSTLNYAAKRHGVHGHRNRHECDARCAQFRDLLERGMSGCGAAKIVGISASRAYQRLKLFHPDWKWPPREWWLKARPAAGVTR